MDTTRTNKTRINPSNIMPIKKCPKCKGKQCKCDGKGQRRSRKRKGQAMSLVQDKWGD